MCTLQLKSFSGSCFSLRAFIFIHENLIILRGWNIKVHGSRMPRGFSEKGKRLIAWCKKEIKICGRRKDTFGDDDFSRKLFHPKVGATQGQARENHLPHPSSGISSLKVALGRILIRDSTRLCLKSPFSTQNLNCLALKSSPTTKKSSLPPLHAIIYV